MNFIPGSKYEKTIKDLVEFTKLEIKIYDNNFSEGYKKFKEKHLDYVDRPTSCYKCLMPIKGKSMIIQEQRNKIIISTYYFHEKCFDEMIKK